MVEVEVMLVKKCPEEQPLFRRVRELIVSGILTLVRLIALVLVLISGTLILTHYHQLLDGHVLNELQKLQFDYSVSVFTGSAIYLFVYGYKVEDMIKKICGVLDVPRVDA